ncbi:MAG: radical SAM protein [bacterium]
MRVLLISSNLSSQFHAILPNGVVSLSAYLKQHGKEVKVCHMESRLHFRTLRKTLREYEPHVVGISANAPEIRYVPVFAAISKRIHPDVPVLAGGVHASLVPETFLEIDGIDAVCLGEGEEPLLEYVNKLEASSNVTDTRNFWFKNDGEIIKNEIGPFIQDLDALPFMDREAINYKRTIFLNSNYITTIAGRGCAGNCTFCANPRLRRVGKGKWVRIRSVDNVLEDFDQLRRKFHFSYVNFRDDNLCAHREWLMEFCEKYPDKFSWPFDCFSRCDTLDDEMIQVLAKSGCRHVFLGLDTGNDYIRNKVLLKGTKNETLVEVAEKLNRHGIKAVISNIIGLPYETPEKFKETIEINRQIHKNQVIISSAYGAAPKLWVFNPWPGTPVYDLCKDEGWLREIPRSHRVYRETYIEMPEFTPRQIYYYYSMFRYLVYKDSHPVFALLFRFYDHRITRFFSELVPGFIFCYIRHFFSEVSLRLKPKNIGSKSRAGQKSEVKKTTATAA